MLEKFREGSQGLGAKIILGAVIVTFALAGVSSYLGSSSSQSAATVNGVEISRQALENQVRNDKAQMQAQDRESFDARWENPAFQQQFRQQSLNKLVAQSLLQQMTEDLSLRVGDEQIRELIFSMDQFKTDGKFNEERYVSLLRQNGMTPALFVERLRAEMAQQQLQSALMATEFALPSEVKNIAALQNQERQLSQLVLPVAKFTDGIEITDEEVSSYYNERQEQFQTPQKVSVDYILVDMKKIADTIDVDADAVSKYYEEHKASYTTEEKRKVAHILIQFGDDEAKAQEKANGILAQINAGADFAALAKSDSDDTFSGEQGGELDWLEKGVMDPAFEGAAFALQNKGDVTAQLVRSEFGFHIIKLVDIQAAKVKPLSEVKLAIESRLQHDLAADKFYDQQQLLVEQAFEVPESLDAAAESTGLTIVSTELFAATQAPEPLNAPEVLDQIFNEDFILEQANSDLINLSDEQSIVVRVNQHKAQATKPLDDVKADITARLTQQKAEQKARVVAKSITDKLTAGESIESELQQWAVIFSEPQWLNRFDYAKADFKILTKLFTMVKPQPEKASFAVETGLNGDVTILELSDVRTSELKEGDEQRLAGSLKNMNGQADYQLLIQSLMEAADVKYSVSQTQQ